MKRFYFPKPMVASGSFGMNLVFVNDREEKLSIAGDNSHVADHTIRHSVAVFDAKGNTLREDESVGDADKLVALIADHMGFTLQPK